MDTMSAFAMGDANRGKTLMVFDWDKAANIIKEKGVKNVRAGLSGDWEYTGGDILIDGEIPEDHCTYLASTWATPEIEIDGDVVDCYTTNKDWDSDTFWPESARKILDTQR